MPESSRRSLWPWARVTKVRLQEPRGEGRRGEQATDSQTGRARGGAGEVTEIQSLEAQKRHTKTGLQRGHFQKCLRRIFSQKTEPTAEPLSLTTNKIRPPVDDDVLPCHVVSRPASTGTTTLDSRFSCRRSKPFRILIGEIRLARRDKTKSPGFCPLELIDAPGRGRR